MQLTMKKFFGALENICVAPIAFPLEFNRAVGNGLPI
jgi:hypothetical protein